MRSPLSSLSFPFSLSFLIRWDLVIVILCFSLEAVGEEVDFLDLETKADTESAEESRYLIPPHPVDEDAINQHKVIGTLKEPQTILEFLPDVNPTLEGSDKSVNPQINKNLFFAANNSRIPGGSFTSYHGGLGEAVTPQSQEPSNTPAAMFNSFWVGISPVTKCTFTVESRLDTISPLTTIASGGGEGGGDFPNSVVSIVNEDVFSFDNLQDFYSQIYLSFFNQEAFLINSSILKEDISFYPHFSFTGNVTSSNSVLRYYTGLINEHLKLSAYYTPINETASRSPYGARAVSKSDKLAILNDRVIGC